ncbi:hypothetical protein ACERII_00150 [Evansella sp. AB-rgal1]|uniref:hypothetical protein n=1 Tax=Evansella sp. AB-rgal1 TaxID=3242696 RepID=UPI00359E32C0
MSKIKELKVQEYPQQVFQHIISFTKEMNNPMLMKKEMDKLIERLGRKGHKHKHRVITKVLARNEEMKTLTLQIMVPLKENYDVTLFLKDHEEYELINEYYIKDSLKISIPNDMNEFKRAVNTFVNYYKDTNINELDLKNNHIIEIAKVDAFGTVIGFDLHLETEKEEV